MNRRKFLHDAGAAVALATLPLNTGAREAQGKIAMRPIPSTCALLPIVRSGSSSIFSGDDFTCAASLLDALPDLVGKFLDICPPAQPTFGRHVR